MKKRLCLLLACALVLAYAGRLDVRAASTGTCGENLTWTLDDAGTLTISGTGDMADFGGNSSPWAASDAVWVVIAEDGVTGIGDNAFYDCYNLMEVYLADSVTAIGENAFARCFALGELDLGSGMQSIGSYAFTECESLMEVTIPASVDTVGQGAFEYCSSLEGIWVDEENPHFCNDESGVLLNKDKTQLLQAPGSLAGTYTVSGQVAAIAPGAFYGCTGLTEIAIPAAVTQIGSHAFADCTSLNRISVDSNNPAYCSDNRGVLYTKDQSVLIQAPMGLTGAYSAAKHTTQVSAYAFSGCDKITAVTLPDSISEIQQYAFRGCRKLNTVRMGKNIRTIGNYAYYGCGALTDVYYNGSESAWKTVAVGVGNDPLCNASVHYAVVTGDTDNDGKLTTDDAVYLLLHIMFGAVDYPLPADTDTDYDGSGNTDTDDAVYLLLHVMFGAQDYPLFGHQNTKTAL